MGALADEAPSGWEWNGSQPGQGATELGFPRPALWQMQGEAACRAGEPSGQGEDPSSEAWWSRCSPKPMRAVQRAIMRHHLNRQLGALAAKRPDGGFSPTPYWVAYGVLDLGWRR